ncbi:hypothetical protein B9T38_11945 [Acinetobacter sp. ANC 4218]|uniref:hypothetical protein n=1 Tax=Acinetobacter sp. ANC 4218 TaxID=1977880 RepID=UPI000A333281|nr:hypothetical protein [Acinetobacter sp. ANC 4218]OTG70568.1 hypothetical protein B9T38_11945 [Acinetobacter sp. ANC 4218]
MASVIVSEDGVGPWYFGLGLKPGATIGTLVGIDDSLIDQLFKYQTFLKKCEDALIANNLDVLKPITTISNTYTSRYTPTDRDAFKQIPMTEFTTTTSNWGLEFTTIWQRFYEYTSSTGEKLYFRLDFGISAKPGTSGTYEFYETTAYCVTVGTSLGSENVEHIIGQRYFPHVPDRASLNQIHSKFTTTTDFYFAANEDTVFFSFGGYRAARYGALDGRLALAIYPGTLPSGPVFTLFDRYSADVPKITEAGVYFPPRLATSADTSNFITVATPSSVSGSGTASLAKVVLQNGVFETANTGCLCTEVRAGASVGRIYGMPFTMAISSGMLVAKDLMLLTDPDISSFNIQDYPFYVGENKKTVVRLPCMGQTAVGHSKVSSLISFSDGHPDTFRAMAQTVLGVLLDESPVFY